MPPCVDSSSSIRMWCGNGYFCSFKAWNNQSIMLMLMPSSYHNSNSIISINTCSSSDNLPHRASISSPPSPNLHNYFFNSRSTQTRRRAAPIFTYLHQGDISSPSTFTAKGWTEFSENVSGEWDGFGADFTVEGKPIELPESVVPEAYREWEVKVFDWQTQCPTLAHLDHHNSPSLMYKTIKLLPTVGCEADAATRYSIQERNINTHHKDSTNFAYQSGGCYVAVWPVTTINQTLELEHCLIDPRNKESRVRIIQVLELQDDSELKLQSIKVFVEQWYGPFRNGDQLGGCALRESAFAASQPLNASQVAGVWQGLHVVATFDTSKNMIQQLGDEHGVRKSIRDEVHLILLPKQLWCSVKRAENEDTYLCEVGWLLDKGRAITSKCTFSSTGELKEMAMASETVTLV